MNDEQGLYGKYIVTKADGTPVSDCFVLRPTKDLAARMALKEYARLTKNVLLAEEIMEWLRQIRDWLRYTNRRGVVA